MPLCRPTIHRQNGASCRLQVAQGFCRGGDFGCCTFVQQSSQVPLGMVSAAGTLPGSWVRRKGTVTDVDGEQHGNSSRGCASRIHRSSEYLLRCQVIKSLDRLQKTFSRPTCAALACIAPHPALRSCSAHPNRYLCAHLWIESGLAPSLAALPGCITLRCDVWMAALPVQRACGRPSAHADWSDWGRQAPGRMAIRRQD